MSGFAQPWQDELNIAKSLVTNLRDALYRVGAHRDWLVTVGADGNAAWEAQGASANDIAMLRGAFDQLATLKTYGETNSLWAYAQNIYQGQ